MALRRSKHLLIVLNTNSNRNLPALGNSFRYVLPVVHCSSSPAAPTEKLSKAMQIYLDKFVKYDTFIKQQLQEYQLGKKFLENMMGRKSRPMSQAEIDEAIDYLFPCALFVPKSRPLMKPPEEIYKAQKEIGFDSSGRPFHYLFYTTKPNFEQCLHDAAVTLEKLDSRAFSSKPPEPLSIAGGNWLTKEELEKKFSEKLYELEYEKFLEIFNKLAEHPFATTEAEFIKSYRKPVLSSKQELRTPQLITQDGVKVSTIENARRKTSSARVSVSSPGTGKICINNMEIDYFFDITCREQDFFVQPKTRSCTNVNKAAI